MCGRARCALAREAFCAASGIPPSRWQDADRYHPANNMSPGGWIPIIRASADQNLEVATCKWGLVPSFHKQGTPMDHWKMFNARSETVHTSPVFRRLLPHKRCVVLLNGFYEWKAEGAKRKQPYYIYLKAERDATEGISGKAAHQEPLMAIAGLWDVAPGDDGQPVASCTLLTCDSATSLAWLHDRMPVLLDSAQAVEAWLGAALPPGWAVHEPGTSNAAQQQPSSRQEGAAARSGIPDEAKCAAESQISTGVGKGDGSAARQHATLAAESAAAAAAAAAAAGGAAADVPVGPEDLPYEHEKVQASEQAEEDAAGSPAAGRQDAVLVVQQVCHPYNGKDLSWHPVTPSMTNPSYQAADCCADMRTRKGAITSFFMPKKAAASSAQLAAARNSDDCAAAGEDGQHNKMGGGGAGGKQAEKRTADAAAAATFNPQHSKRSRATADGQ